MNKGSISDLQLSRFAGVVLLRYIDSALLLSIYGVGCSVFCLAVSQVSGRAGIGCFFALFFFESICYPVSKGKVRGLGCILKLVQCIFTLGTKNLGPYTKRGSGLIVMVSFCR